MSPLGHVINLTLNHKVIGCGIDTDGCNYPGGSYSRVAAPWQDGCPGVGLVGVVFWRPRIAGTRDSYTNKRRGWIGISLCYKKTLVRPSWVIWNAIFSVRISCSVPDLEDSSIMCSLATNLFAHTPPLCSGAGKAGSQGEEGSAPMSEYRKEMEGD
jgi:hypothetical protein